MAFTFAKNKTFFFC